MRVLLANDCGLDYGGISVFMLQWIYGIKEVNPSSEVFVYFRGNVTDSEMEKRYKETGTTIVYGNIAGNVSFKNSDARKKVLYDIQTIIAKNNIEIVHVNSNVYGFTSDILAKAREMKVPIRIAHAHGQYPESYLDKVIHFILRQLIIQNATAYAGCSKMAGICMFGNKAIKSSKWHFVPNTINVEKYSFRYSKREEYRNIINVSPDELLLGAVGRMTKGKNHTFLIDLVKDLKINGLSAKLVILGDGPQRSDIQKRISENGIQTQVIMKGAVSNVSEWLSAMDYYLMPSMSEGLGISAVEAQANGLVCLLSDRIPKEVDLTKDVYHLSITEGTYPWVKVIIKSNPVPLNKRIEAISSIRRAGFDEKATPEYVKKLYSI